MHAMYEGYRELLVEKQERILLIRFNNPKKKNAVNALAYEELGRVLRAVNGDEDVSMVVLTGEGEFFTAGNDLSAAALTTDIETFVEKSNQNFKQMVSAFIDCEKVVVALVNGPAIGIGATLAGLADMMWCSETAYFSAPFGRLGLVPEAASSYVFPLIMGRSKATEMLIFSEKLSAEEAFKFNFASKVYKHSEVNSVIWPKLREFSQLSKSSILISKRLIRQHDKESLHRALDAECVELKKRFVNEDFITAIMEFAMKRGKSKL